MLRFEPEHGCLSLTLTEGDVAAPTRTIVIAGDWAPMLEHESLVMRDPSAVYGELLPILQAADLAVVNLEGVIGPPNLQPIVKDGDCLLLPEAALAALRAVPFQVACLANNHVMDCGPAGLNATLMGLDSIGTTAVGAWSNEAVPGPTTVVHIGEVRVGLLNLAEGEEGRANGGVGVADLDPLRIANDIARLRATADLIIAIIHVGREFVPAPMPHVVAFCQGLVDQGVDAVIGHHPHVAQGVSLYRGAPIAFSLGNFVFQMGTTSAAHERGYLARLVLRGTRIHRFELWPYRSSPTGLRWLTPSEAADSADALQQLSSLCQAPDRLVAIWDAYADVWWQRHGLGELRDSVLALTPDALPAGLRVSAQGITGRRLVDRLNRRALRIAERVMAGLTGHRAVARTPQVTRAAAVLRNRFDTPAHRELVLRALRRVIDGTMGTAPAWAYDWVHCHVAED